MEKFEVPQLMVRRGGELAMLSQGILNGLALISGHNYSMALPVLGGLGVWDSMKWN